MSSGDPHKGICKDSLASDNLDSLRNINSNEQDEK